MLEIKKLTTKKNIYLHFGEHSEKKKKIQYNFNIVVRIVLQEIHPKKKWNCGSKF